MARFASLTNLFRSRYAVAIAALAGVVAVLAVLYAVGWLAALVWSPWFWASLAVLVGVGIFVALRWGLPWLQERRFVKHESSEYVAAGQASPEEFRAKFAAAVQALKALPQLQGTGDPIFALPWYLLIGPTRAGKTAALQGSHLFLPLLPIAADGAGTQNHDWWVSKTALLIDTAGRYVIPVEPARDRADWYRLLRLLRHYREVEPVNGLVLAVSAEWLASQPLDGLRADASKLRERLEETVRELGIDAPVYLVVTCCDVIEGFAEFFSQLPERMHGEALGWVNDTGGQGVESQRGAAALRRLSEGLQTIYERLHFFRLAMIDSQAPESVRQGVFCFPEEFKALQQPLLAFAEPLLSEDVRYHSPLFRAIYFASAEQGGTQLSLVRPHLNLGGDRTTTTPGGKPHFLADVFDTLLPRDRGLVTPTSRAQTRRGLRRLLSVGAVLATVLVVAAVLVRAFTLDRHIVDAVDPAVCPETAAPTRGADVEVVERCRRAVQALQDANRQRPVWSTWFFNRAAEREDHLRQRYVASFKAQVLDPLNTELDGAFTESADPLPLMLLVAQRTQLNHQCVAAAAGDCSERTLDEVHPDYALMLNPMRERRAPPEAATTFKQAYAAYLLWQPGSKQLLQQDLASDQQRLTRWLSTKQFTLDSLLPLVNRGAAPITTEDYWELPAPIAAGAAQVDAACTKKVWEQDVAPFLQQLQDAVPDAASKLRAFQEQYRTICLREWQSFLTAFPSGVDRWKGPERRRTLALRLLSQQSPVRRVVDDASTNLVPWVSPTDSSSAPPWAAELRAFATSDQRKVYEAALAKIGTVLEHDAIPEASFKLAQEAFAEGKPSAQAASPMLRAWSVAAPQSGSASQKSDDAVLTPLLQEPLRFVWRVLLEQAATYVQDQWAENVIAPLKGMQPAEQALQLYGPGGKVGAFGEQYLRTFFTDGDVRTIAVLGEALPLSPRFLAVLANAKELKPVLEGGAVTQPVVITAGEPSKIESRGPLLGEESTFAVSCAGKSYRVTDRPQAPSEASVTVPWSSQSCGDVTVSVYFFAGEPGGGQGMLPGAKRSQLTKTYGGRSGFLQFLQDFAEGSHRFRMDDFPSADPDTLRSGVSAVAMFYKVDLPSPLTKLLSALRTGTAPDSIVSLSPS